MKNKKIKEFKHYNIFGGLRYKNLWSRTISLRMQLLEIFFSFFGNFNKQEILKGGGGGGEESETKV